MRLPIHHSVTSSYLGDFQLRILIIDSIGGNHPNISVLPSGVYKSSPVSPGTKGVSPSLRLQDRGAHARIEIEGRGQAEHRTFGSGLVGGRANHFWQHVLEHRHELGWRSPETIGCLPPWESVPRFATWMEARVSTPLLIPLIPGQNLPTRYIVDTHIGVDALKARAFICWGNSPMDQFSFGAALASLVSWFPLFLVLSELRWWHQLRPQRETWTP